MFTLICIRCLNEYSIMCNIKQNTYLWTQIFWIQFLQSKCYQLRDQLWLKNRGRCLWKRFIGVWMHHSVQETGLPCCTVAHYHDLKSQNSDHFHKTSSLINLLSDCFHGWSLQFIKTVSINGNNIFSLLRPRLNA